jgi:hypothetical protein
MSTGSSGPGPALRREVTISSRESRGHAGQQLLGFPFRQRLSRPRRINLAGNDRDREQ